MTRTSRNVTVGLIVTLGLAGVGWTASADRSNPDGSAVGRRRTAIATSLEQSARRCWTGIRSSSTRSLRRIRRTPPVSGSGRSFTRRSSMPTTASNGATRQSSFTTERPARRVAPSGGHRCGVHGAGRPVPVATAGAGCQLCGVARGAERRLRATATRADAARARRVSSAASPGEPRSRRPCSPGARPMGSARATRRSPAGPRSASGGRHRRRSAR